ncbi:MAG: hypothetical protein JXM70_24695 [Pirellulales bacterium]|nr:hypothetical protein [Pirellulales bacterium]
MEPEFTYRFPRWSLVIGLILGPLMIVAGAAGLIVPWLGGTPFTGESLRDDTQLSIAALLAYELGVVLLILTGVLQMVVAVLVIRAGGHSRRRIRLTPDAMIMPRGFMSANEQTIEYEKIRKIGVHGWLGRRNVVVTHADGRASILGIALVDELDNQVLIDELARRTSLEPVPILRFPRQFTLSSLLIFTTVFSIVLGLRMSYSRELGWLDLIVPLGFTITLAAIIFLLTRRSWTPRIFIIGFVIGGLIDAATLAAICVIAGVDSAILDRTWFPLSAVIFRINYNIHALGWGTGWEETAVLTCGAAITGVICGIAAVQSCQPAKKRRPGRDPAMKRLENSRVEKHNRK